MPMFDAILEKAHNLCGAEYGALQLYDGEMFRDQAESVARGLSSGPINVAAAKSGTRTLLLLPLRRDTSQVMRP